MDDKSKIIPINRKLIRSLTEMMKCVRDQPWDGPATFNAILVDRADMYKMVKVKNPPPQVIYLPIRPGIEICFSSESADTTFDSVRRFHFWKRVGDYFHYREVGS